MTKTKKLEVLRTMRRNDVLADGVIRRMGGMESFLENYEDIIEYGAGNGVNGFIRTYDNRQFVCRYIDEILDAIQNYIDDPLTIAHCVKDVNSMAWTAVEIICERFGAELSQEEEEN